MSPETKTGAMHALRRDFAFPEAVGAYLVVARNWPVSPRRPSLSLRSFRLLGLSLESVSRSEVRMRVRHEVAIRTRAATPDF